MSSKGNIRRHSRADTAAPLQIIWKDHGGLDKFTNARALDVSESGMRIEVIEPLPERSYVTLRSDKLGLQGSASVRSCTRKGLKYVVGLEFSAGMKYKPKVTPVVQEAPMPVEAEVPVDADHVPAEQDALAHR